MSMDKYRIIKTDFYKNFAHDQCTSETPTTNQLKKSSPKVLMQRLIENLENTDFQVKIGNWIFNCHLMVLQCYAEYFKQALFQNQRFVELPSEQVSPTTFTKIYEWMLTDEPKIQREEIIELFISAYYLGIEALTKQIWACLNNVDIIRENVAYMLYYEAALLHVKCVKELMLKRISKFFLILVAFREFLFMSIEDLCCLLSSDEIGVNTEIEIFMCCLRWLSHKWHERKRFIFKVMKRVRFGLMPPGFLIELERNMIDNRLIKSVMRNAKVRQLVLNGLKLATTQFCYGNSINVKPRQWLYDEKCQYHLKINQLIEYKITYEKFLEYLHFLQKCDKDHWRAFVYIKTEIQTITSQAELRHLQLLQQASKNCIIEADKKAHISEQPTTSKLLLKPERLIQSKKDSDINSIMTYKEWKKSEKKTCAKIELESSHESSDAESENWQSFEHTKSFSTEHKKSVYGKRSCICQKCAENLKKSMDLQKQNNESKEEVENIKKATATKTENILKENDFEKQNPKEIVTTSVTEYVTPSEGEFLKNLHRDTPRKNMHHARKHTKRHHFKTKITELKKLETEVEKPKQTDVNSQAINNNLQKKAKNPENIESENFNSKKISCKSLFKNKTLFILGGTDPYSKVTKKPLQKKTQNFIDKVLLYNEKFEKWAQLPHTAFGIRQHHAAVVCNGLIYICGGTKVIPGCSKSFFETSIWVFNPKTKIWTFETNLPQNRRDFAALAIECKKSVNNVGFLIIGGETFDRIPLNTVWLYKIKEKIWERKAPLNIGRYGFAAAIVDGNEIWIAGGIAFTPPDKASGDSQFKTYTEFITDTIETYNFENIFDKNFKGIWQQSAQRLRRPCLYGKFCVTPKNGIFLMGGFGVDADKVLNSFDSIDRFDFEQKVWSQCAVLNYARHGHDAVLIDDYILVIGGVSSKLKSALQSIEVFSTKSHEVFRLMPDLPWALSGLAAVIVRGEY